MQVVQVGSSYELFLHGNDYGGYVVPYPPVDEEVLVLPLPEVEKKRASQRGGRIDSGH